MSSGGGDAETAYAKLNLALHVRERMAGGYHRIETIFAFCADGDEVALASPEGEGLGVGPVSLLRPSGADHTPHPNPSPEGEGLLIDGPFAEGLSAGPDNLVLRAAQGLGGLFGFEVPPLRLTKRLPVAAGIGGGSADAAAAIRLLCRLRGINPRNERVLALAASLGADVPACMTTSVKRGTGRGDELVDLGPHPSHPAAPGGPLPSPVGRGREPRDARRKVKGDRPSIAGMPVLLVNPRVPLATGPVFAAWDGIDRGPLAGGDPMAAAVAGRNDLEAPALSLCPAIGEVLAALGAQPGTRLVRMSGSGATCFALFESMAAREAARDSLRKRTGWWCLATELI